MSSSLRRWWTVLALMVAPAAALRAGTASTSARASVAASLDRQPFAAAAEEVVVEEVAALALKRSAVGRIADEEVVHNLLDLEVVHNLLDLAAGPSASTLREEEPQRPDADRCSRHRPEA